MRAALRFAAAASAVAVMLGPASALWAAGPGDPPFQYQLPPDPIPALLATEAPPMVMVGPRRDRLALLQRRAAPPIAELARPVLGLAGLTVDPLNNGPARLSAYDGLTFIDLADGAERRAALPADARVIAPVWSPDGRSLAFLMLRPDEVELWVASAADGTARRVTGGVNAAFPRAYAWLPDSDGFLVRRVIEDRGPPPQADDVPSGPVVQESEPGRAAPLATVQNLLSSPADEALFDYYFTSSLTRVDLYGGAPETLGPPGLIIDSLPSPDGRYILDTRLQHPFSYSVGASSFPTAVVIRDRGGEVARRIVDRPLQELAASDVPAGPRSVQWREDAPATLVWAEQPGEDGRDRLFALAAPFDREPTLLLDVPGRFSRIFWARDDLAVVASSADRKQQRTVVDPSRPGEGRMLPGAFEPVMRADAEGRERLQLTPDGGAVLVRAGRGLASVDLRTGQRTPHWAPDGPGSTALEAVLDDAGETLLVRRQSRTDPPNLFVVGRTGDAARAVTRFTDPAPQLAGLQQRVLTYRRADGLPLSATLYLPAGYRTGVDAPLPVLVWAYPGAVANREAVRGGGRGGDVFERPQGFDDIDLFLLTQGYAVLRADMPVVADGGSDTVQGHTPQLVANAAAAIDAAAATGAVDRDRAAIGGHSFGAAMAANLLAHSDLFRAGVSLSGAYNRTLTPFGFQATERRSFWEAPDEYMAISPFAFADRIDEPILLMHGGADSNSGTLPMQSERFFAALKGHGATARYVLLPHEGHEYRARESLQHALWEITEWLDRHVRDATD
ncbi:prolyl oligopeptidase family serine peptidase [Roseibacterium beibuensis]|uniref:S9 family peptidase n=1 Tax=[Roseibacterium] beibuensis TaxID=1193142 RepID=UPI00217E9167|nr:prolyl oligopeptidase family serine peptidase [Roseibacterium beibuensis]MCS6624522.1 prolyl oligopeptidase family serine peptidase [Roseibacterium beibuensis]